jgi:hypothetical protein
MVLNYSKLSPWIVPALMLGNILCHLVLIHTTPLTRWKGGGFGMYSSMHPHTKRSIWIETQSGPEKSRLRYKEKNFITHLNAKNMPTRKHLEAIKDEFRSGQAGHFNAITVEVWELIYHPQKNQLTQALISKSIFYE